MINWTDFKDGSPTQADLDKAHESILIAEPTTGFAGIPTFDIYQSSFRTGNGCYTNKQGDYTEPQAGVFWAILNTPYPTSI